MNKYKIVIEETLRQTVEVEENNPSLAISEAENRYNASEIVLSADDYQGTNIALASTDKTFLEYQEREEFRRFVDIRFRKRLPELEPEEKITIAFGSPDNAIYDFENRTGEPDKEVIYLLYTCDEWHTNNSRQLVAPFSSKELVYAYLQKNRKKYRLSDWDMEFFKDKNQTQHLGENLIMECHDIDPDSEDENLDTPFYNKVFSSGTTQLTRRELEELSCPLCTKNISDEVMQQIVSEADEEIKKWDYDDDNEELEFKYEDIRIRETENAAVRHKVPYYEDLD